MTTTSSAELIKAKQEIEDTVARIMRLLVDMTVEDKRRVVTEIDRLVSYEESTHAVANKQTH